MGDKGQERQIKQMVAFILQEAEEKCKEIKIKVRIKHRYIRLIYKDIIFCPDFRLVTFDLNEISFPSPLLC